MPSTPATRDTTADRPHDTRTIDQLTLSPWNVRVNEQDAMATTALEASILDRHSRGRAGLILPLVVHPMKGSRTKWGVHAGGRRYRSLKALIERGDLPADYAIDVVVHDLSDAELMEDSTAENLLRRDLRPYELFRAVTRTHRKGETPAQIAKALGQEITWVRQAIRLGNLAKPIFEALETNKIDLEQARAYAATEDEALQLAAFEALREVADYEKTPQRIRARLGVGDAERARLLRFVGREAYEAAGGGYELDLFAEGEVERGLITNPELLRKLVEEKTGGMRDAARVRMQRADLRFVSQPPRNDFGTDYTLQITPKVLNPDTSKLPDGDVVAYMTIPESGQPEVSYWWASRKAKFGTEKKPTAKEKVTQVFGTGASALGGSSHFTKPAANAAIKEEAGLTQLSIDMFRSIRRAILRAAFVQDAQARGGVAIDYLIFVQLRFELNERGELGMRRLVGSDHGPIEARDLVAPTAAGEIWRQAMFELQRQSFVTSDDLVQAYLDYRASSPALKRQAEAIVAGMALERSLNADGYRFALHDAIAADLDLTDDEGVRRLWQPDAAFLDLLPKDERLKIAEPLVESASFGPWQRLKTAEITPLVLAVVTGTSNVVRASCASIAANWVHPLLRFRSIGADVATAGDQLEAAE